ncbi:MAG: TPM domain-containing protein [Rhodanobacteraceae bacterium]
MDAARWLHHLLHAPVSRRYSPEAMAAIQQAIAEGEVRHDGELCFVAEAKLPMRFLIGGRGARTRAGDLFARLRVWDTHRRGGVLVYVLLADRAIEIIADRGVAARVPAPGWDGVMRVMQERFQQDDWTGGALAGIKAAHVLLARYLPPTPGKRHELPDKPLLL